MGDEEDMAVDKALRTTNTDTKVAKNLAHASMGTRQEGSRPAPEIKRRDLRFADCPDSPSPDLSGLLADGFLQLTSPNSKGDPSQKAPHHMEVDTAVPSGASSRGGASKGSLSNLFRQDHWRG